MIQTVIPKFFDYFSNGIISISQYFIRFEVNITIIAYSQRHVVPILIRKHIYNLDINWLNNRVSSIPRTMGLTGSIISWLFHRKGGNVYLKYI